jgi:Flp pilus assembly pilin Flp
MKPTRSIVRRLLGNESGAELVEWAIWVGAIAAAAVLAAATIGTTISAGVANILAKISGA